MDIDVSIGKESLSLYVENPHRFDMAKVVNDIVDFGKKSSIDLSPQEIESLIQRMVRGVAGCERGCPADAKSLAMSGYGNFKLSYTDGGILTAKDVLENNQTLEIQVFPGFD